MLRLLLVDDNETFLGIVKRFVAAECRQPVEVVAIAECGDDGFAAALSLQPHVALVDIDRPDREGLAIIRQLRSMFPTGGIIATALPDPGLFDYYRQTAIAHGADDLLLKDALTRDLMPAVHRLAQGVSDHDDTTAAQTARGHENTKNDETPAGFDADRAT